MQKGVVNGKGTLVNKTDGTQGESLLKRERLLEKECLLERERLLEGGR